MSRIRDIANAGAALNAVSATELGYLDGVTSAVQTQLNQKPEFVAGKNHIINGAFDIWQRGTSISLTNNTWTYTADRMIVYSTFSAGTSSFSQQSFTAGAAPVAGYENPFFGRLTCGSTSTYFQIEQKIEGVRTLAGQTITVSFWAKSSATPTVKIGVYQEFGTGGSTGVATFGSTDFALTSSWVRYSRTISVPSISGKTIGANNSLNANMTYVSGTINSATVDIWGFQVESGSVATAFQTATGTDQGELAACQRYYYRVADSSQNYTAITVMHDTSLNGTTTGNTIVSHPVPMRTAPISTEFSNIGFHRYDGTLYSITAVTIDTATDSIYGAMYGLTISGSPTPAVGHVGRVIGNNNSGAYFAVNAEL